MSAGILGCLPAAARALDTAPGIDGAAWDAFVAAQRAAGLTHGTRAIRPVLSPSATPGTLWVFRDGELVAARDGLPAAALVAATAWRRVHALIDGRQ